MSQAKIIFEQHIDALRTQAKKSSVELYLMVRAALAGKGQTFNSPISLAHALDPKRAELNLIESYRLQYYEMIANAGLEKFKELQKDRDSRKKGGDKRAAQLIDKRQENIARILEAEANLLGEGQKERGINKRIASKLNFETEYVRKVRKERNRTRNQIAAS